MSCERVQIHRHLIKDGCAVLKAPQDGVFPLGCQENMKLLFQKQFMPPCFISETLHSCRCHRAVSASDRQDSMEQFMPIRLVKGRIQPIFQRGEVTVLMYSYVLLVFGMLIYGLSIKNVSFVPGEG